jgi:hypothetical protein
VTSNIYGEKKTVPVPKGMEITISVPGLHYNRTYLVVFIRCLAHFSPSKQKTLSARYWKDPHTFNPSRFLAADWPRDAFIPFNSGEEWEYLFFWHDVFFIHMKYMQDPVHASVESILLISNQNSIL